MIYGWRVIRRLMGVLTAAIVLSSLLGQSPARAGGLAYEDSAGDATEIFEVDTPRPSDPELDVLHVDWSTSVDTLTIVTRLTELGEPIASNGSAYIQSFVYEGERYEFLQQVSGSPSNQVFPAGLYFRPTDDPVREFSCSCSARFDFTGKTLTITASLKSMAAAFREYQPDAPRFGPGSVIEAPITTTQRFLGLLFTADHAQPPAGTRLVV